jgi:hypothetical protein
MQTIFGMPYTPPTPDEVQALVREAHRERAETIREMWSALFRWRRATKGQPPVTYASLRPSL